MTCSAEESDKATEINENRWIVHIDLLAAVPLANAASVDL